MLADPSVHGRNPLGQFAGRRREDVGVADLLVREALDVREFLEVLAHVDLDAEHDRHDGAADGVGEERVERRHEGARFTVRSSPPLRAAGRVGQVRHAEVAVAGDEITAPVREALGPGAHARRWRLAPLDFAAVDAGLGDGAVPVAVEVDDAVALEQDLGAVRPHDDRVDPRREQVVSGVEVGELEIAAVALGLGGVGHACAGHGREG